jgi:hypothetical protein
MAPWQRQLRVVASLWLLSFGSLPSLAAPPAATDPAPELLAAYRVLDRLMAPASIEAPITLVVRPFRGAVCPPQAADPVARTQAAATTQPLTESGICLSTFELPPRLRQGFFVPFVVSLQRQTDPESDPERASAAIEGRTILLNATRLELVWQASTPASRHGREAGPALLPEATCRIAQEFAAVQLGQPRQLRESFDRIHTLLADRIHKVAVLSHRGRSAIEWAGEGVMFMAKLYYIIPAIGSSIDAIQGRNLGHWINARLAESPHWQVLQQHAPGVATALKELRGLVEFDVAQAVPQQTSISWALSISQAWGQIDGWFGVAAQERDEVIEEQRKQAQAEAVRLMAAAGIDPRSCADVFLSVSAAEPDEAVLKAYEQARRKWPDSGPSLPRRFLPTEQKVVIFPRIALPDKGNSGAGSQSGPPGTNR